MEIVSALERPVEEQREAFNLSFSDYIAGGRTLDLPGFGDILVSHGVCLPGSFLALSRSQVAGFAYLCVFGTVTRLAIMGVVPAHRRRGIARALLERVLEEVRRQGQSLLTLEVIVENVAAARLYHDAGLRPRRRLYGYAHDGAGRGEPSQAPAAHRRPEPVHLDEAIGRLIAGDRLRLPYQVSGYALARAPRSCAAYGLDSALVVIRPGEGGRTVLRALHDDRPDGAALRALVASLMDATAEGEWRIPQILPEEIGEPVLVPLGYRRLPMNQLQMELPLTPGP